MKLAPGTPCYITQLSEMSGLNGRVVTVVSGPMPAEDFSDEYEVRAAWAHELFPDGMIAARRNLKPITPPEKPATKRKEVAH